MIFVFEEKVNNLNFSKQVQIYNATKNILNSFCILYFSKDNKEPIRNWVTARNFWLTLSFSFILISIFKEFCSELWAEILSERILRVKVQIAQVSYWPPCILRVPTLSSCMSILFINRTFDFAEGRKIYVCAFCVRIWLRRTGKIN